MLRLDTRDGCPPPAPDDAEVFLGSLRPLDPAADVTLIGPVHRDEFWGDQPLKNELLEEVVRITFNLSSPPSLDGATVETLRRRDSHAVLLITTVYKPGYEIREGRRRVVLVRDSSLWYRATSGSQYWCQPRHGHAEWGPTLCS